MLFKKSDKKNHKRRSSSIKKKGDSKILEFAIVAIFALVAIYAASFAIRITHGFSKTVEAPEFIIRLQILNGCGIDGAANRAAKMVPQLTHLPLEVKVMDVDDFNSYDVSESFIISRDQDLEASKLLARQLGLDDDMVIYQELENNYRSITATLVLGSDVETVVLDSDKE